MVQDSKENKDKKKRENKLTKKSPLDSNKQNQLDHDNRGMLEGMSPLWQEFYLKIGEKLTR